MRSKSRCARSWGCSEGAGCWVLGAESGVIALSTQHSALSTSIQGDDLVLPQLVKNQQRVGLSDRADLDQRADVPLAVDAAEDEALVRAEVHLRDLVDRLRDGRD